MERDGPATGVSLQLTIVPSANTQVLPPGHHLARQSPQLMRGVPVQRLKEAHPVTAVAPPVPAMPVAPVAPTQQAALPPAQVPAPVSRARSAQVMGRC